MHLREHLLRSRTLGAGLAMVTAATLAACGGGSDPKPQDDAVALSGVVAKGPAKGAKVRVYAADGKTAVAPEVTTGDGGSYTVILATGAKGPFLIEADLAGANITDEVTGKIYSGQAGQKLRAVVADAGSVVNVTPFSDMAADLALEGGALTVATTDAANKKIRQVLNNTDFLTASPTSGALLTALQAVQIRVNEEEGGLTAVLAQLREAAADGVVSSDLVKELQAACDTCEAVFNAGTSELPVETGAGIDTVKALFKDLRDTLLAYSNGSGTGDLDQASARITDALSSVVAPVDGEQLQVLAAFREADAMFRDFKAGRSTVTRWRSADTVYGLVAGSSMTSPGVVSRFGCELARATVIDVAGGYKDVAADYTINGLTKDNVNVMTCYGIGTKGRLFPGNVSGTGYYHSVVFIPTGDDSFKYVHQLRKGVTGSATTSRHKAVFGELVVSRGASGELTGFDLEGKLVPGLVDATTESYTLLDRVDTRLSFALAESTGEAQVNMYGWLALMKKDGTQASRVDIASGNIAAKTDVPTSYHDVVYVGASSCPPGYAPAFGTTSPYLSCGGTVSTTSTALGTLSLDVSVAAPGVKFQGIVTAGNPSFDKSGSVYYPRVTSLQGQLYEADGAGYRVLLDGLAKVELQNFAGFDASSGSTSPLKASFDGKLLIKDRPAMGFTFAGTRDVNNQQSGNGSFYWNGKSLGFEAGADKSLVVRNDDGVSFTIPHNGSASFQPIYKGTVQVGRINLDLQRIEYVDGSYEQY